MPQSLSNVLVHLVFSTAHRDLLITPAIREELYPYITGIINGEKNHLIQIGGTADHVHILFDLARTVTIADTVKRVKSHSTTWVVDHFKTRFAWQAGYGVFSIGQREVSDVVTYIQNQEEHHRKISFQDEFRELMQIAGLPLDEKYAWE